VLVDFGSKQQVIARRGMDVDNFITAFAEVSRCIDRMRLNSDLRLRVRSKPLALRTPSRSGLSGGAPEVVYACAS
jgi:hypothetical protein